jgi:hypothetical protein
VELKQHMTVHSVERLHPCSHCGKHFKTPRYAHVHERVVHGKKGTKTCPVCKKYFKTEFEVRKHQKKAHGSKITLSNAGKDSAASLVNHTSLVQGKEKGFKCFQCNSWFLTEFALQQHDSDIHKKVTNSMDLNRNSNADAQTLAQTLGSHVCTLCNKGFASKRNLVRHGTNVHCLKKSEVNSELTAVSSPLHETVCSSSHKNKQSTISNPGEFFPDTVGENSQCPLCLKQFVSKSNMKRHLATVHSSSKETVINCKPAMVSEMKYPDPDPLNGNLQSHVCAICSKTLGSKKSLRRHQASLHSKNKIAVKSELPLTPYESKIADPLCLSDSQAFWLERLFPSVIVTPREMMHSMNSTTLNSFPRSTLFCEEDYYNAECSTRFSSRNSLKQHNKGFHGSMKLDVRNCTDSNSELANQMPVGDGDNDTWVEEYTLGRFGPGSSNKSPYAMKMDNSSRSEGLFYACLFVYVSAYFLLV